MKYTVKLNFLETHVWCDSPEEAIVEGRKQLCIEWPRLWDLIVAKDDSEFEVIQNG